METAASIVAFVALGLNSIRIINQLISAIKDGPGKVGDVSKAACRLQTAFEAIDDFPELSEILTTTPSLGTAITQCKEDIDRFEKKLENLNISSGERMHGVLWKKLKLAFGEKDLAYMLEVISSHADALTMEINLVQTRFIQRQSQSLRQIQTQGVQQVTMMAEHSAALTSVGDRVSNCTIQNDCLRAAVLVLAQNSVDRSQANEILERVAGLERKLSQMNTNSGITTDGVESKTILDESTTTGTSSQEEGTSAITEIIRRLCSLVDQAQCNMGSDDAGQIVDDLDELLCDIIAHNRNRSDPGEATLDRCNNKGITSLKRLRGIFSASPALHLNQDLQSRPVPRIGTLIGQKRNYKEYLGPHGVLTVSSNCRRRRHGTKPGDRELEDHLVTVTLRPKDGSLRYIVKAAIFQSQTLSGFSSLSPSLSISRVRSSDSEVFECVRSGRMHDFLRLLRNGDASLRDRDERGASLLHYAFDKPEICRFLIENGADVDEIADCGDIHWYLKGCLWAPLGLTIDETGSTEIDCFTQLLVAGADPTILPRYKTDRVPYYKKSPLTTIFQMTHLANLDYAKITLDLARTYFDIDSLVEGDETLLHKSCRNVNLGKIRILLERGADINARDINGRSCLHLLLERAASFPRWTTKIREVLVFLVKSGADIYAKYDGKTVSETAYLLGEETSFPGDLWDCVLAICGHRVEEYRTDHIRRARYTSEYSRESFNHLWAGIEDLCPYYNDEEYDDTTDDEGARNIDLPSVSRPDAGVRSPSLPLFSLTSSNSMKLAGLQIERNSQVQSTSHSCQPQTTPTINQGLDLHCDDCLPYFHDVVVTSEGRDMNPTASRSVVETWDCEDLSTLPLQTEMFGARAGFVVDQVTLEAVTMNDRATEVGAGDGIMEDVFWNPWAVRDD